MGSLLLTLDAQISKSLWSKHLILRYQKVFGANIWSFDIKKSLEQTFDPLISKSLWSKYQGLWYQKVFGANIWSFDIKQCLKQISGMRFGIFLFLLLPLLPVIGHKECFQCTGGGQPNPYLSTREEVRMGGLKCGRENNDPYIHPPKPRSCDGDIGSTYCAVTMINHYGELSPRRFSRYCTNNTFVAKIKSDNITTRRGKQGIGNRTILSTLDSCKDMSAMLKEYETIVYEYHWDAQQNFVYYCFCTEHGCNGLTENEKRPTTKSTTQWGNVSTVRDDDDEGSGTETATIFPTTVIFMSLLIAWYGSVQNEPVN